MSKVIDPSRSYSFSQYFEMQAEIDDILNYFSHSLIIETINLPSADIDSALVEQLKTEIESILPYVRLTNETARRELLISPVIFKLIQIVKPQTRIEYSVNVSEQLKGTIDYYLQARTGRILIIEAKKADIDRGFIQLAIELIALAQWLNTDELIYGAVSTGEVWRFGKLNPAQKLVTQDITLLRVPSDIEVLFAVLIGILRS